MRIDSGLGVLPPERQRLGNRVLGFCLSPKMKLACRNILRRGQVNSVVDCSGVIRLRRLLNTRGL